MLYLDDIAQQRQEAYNEGLREPTYCGSYKGDIKSWRLITWPHLYRYGCPAFDF